MVGLDSSCRRKNPNNISGFDHDGAVIEEATVNASSYYLADVVKIVKIDTVNCWCGGRVHTFPRS
jgi:hypothetical protein